MCTLHGSVLFYVHYSSIKFITKNEKTMNYLIKREKTHFRVQTKLNAKTTISQVFINKKTCGKIIIQIYLF